MCTPSTELDPVLGFVAGTIAGIAGLLVGYPFDTVKVRFQNPDIASRYRSTLHAIVKIVHDERFFGLYKGVLSPLVTYAFMNGMIFGAYGFFLKIQLDSVATAPTLGQIMLAGIGSGVVASILTSPIELIKIRQQQNYIEQISARTVAVKIYRKSGVLGFFRGLTATALREASYGPYFFTYEAISRYFAFPSAKNSSPHSRSCSVSLPVLLLAGGLAGVFGWCSTFPFDVVKTRIQSTNFDDPGIPISTSNPNTPLLTPKYPADGSHNVNPYRTTLSTIINSYRNEGISVFFRGLVPTLIRSIPVNMVTFATFEAIVRAFS